MPDDTDMSTRKPDANAVRPVLGAVVGLIPFVLQHRESRSSTVTDTEIRTITRRTSFDYVAVPCGIFALVLGVFGFVKGITARRLAVGLAGVVATTLGVMQIARGFGP